MKAEPLGASRAGRHAGGGRFTGFPVGRLSGRCARRAGLIRLQIKLKCLDSARLGTRPKECRNMARVGVENSDS